MKYYLAIDIGASSGRHIIGYKENEYEDKDVPIKVRNELGLKSQEIDDIRINKRRWVLLNYPSKLDAYKAGMKSSTYFKYGVLKSSYIDNEQCYLIFKATTDKLILNIEGNDVLDYQVNLKHLMIIDITKMRLLKSDIPYLPFI